MADGRNKKNILWTQMCMKVKAYSDKLQVVANLKWTVSMQRNENSHLSAETQPSIACCS